MRWHALIKAPLLFTLAAPVACAQGAKGCEGVGFASHPGSDYTVEKLQKRVEEDRKDVDALVHLGLHLEEGGRSAEALALYNQAMLAKPDCYLGHYFAGMAMDRASGKMTADAESEINKSVNLDPSLRDDPNVQSFWKRHAQSFGRIPPAEEHPSTGLAWVLARADRFLVGLAVGVILTVLAFYVAGHKRS